FQRRVTARSSEKNCRCSGKNPAYQVSVFGDALLRSGGGDPLIEGALSLFYRPCPLAAAAGPAWIRPPACWPGRGEWELCWPVERRVDWQLFPTLPARHWPRL